MIEKINQDGRGGARCGSGRPAKSKNGARVNLTVKIAPTTRRRITALREKGVLIGEAVDDLIKQLSVKYGID